MPLGAAGWAVLGSAAVTAYSSNRASRSAEASSNAATAATTGEQQRQYDQTRADQAPYRQAANMALSRLTGANFNQPAAGSSFTVAGGNVFQNGTPANVGSPQYIQGFGGATGYRTGASPKTLLLNQPYPDKYLPSPRLQMPQQQIPGQQNSAYGGTIDDQGPPLPDYQETPMYAAFQNGGQPLPQYSPAPDFKFDPSQIENNPAYKFRFNQGVEAVNRGAAGAGQLNSGNRLLALQEFGQGLASTEYGNEYARQFGANQDAYNRGVSGYGLNYQRNQDLYNRGVNEYGMGQQRNQDIYGRGVDTYNRKYQQNQDIYGRQQNRLNRYAALANLGQTSLSQTSAAGMNSANQNSAAFQRNALIQGDAANTRYGGLNNAIQGGLSNYMLYNSLKKPSGGQFSNGWGVE